MSDKRYLFRGCSASNLSGEKEEKVTVYDRIYGVQIEVSITEYYRIEDKTITDFYTHKESE